MAVAAGVHTAARSIAAARPVPVGVEVAVVDDLLLTAVVLSQLDRIERARALRPVDRLADGGAEAARRHEACECKYRKPSCS
jgi:hypothetical protein